MTAKPKTAYMIQMNDIEAADMLQAMARADLRSYGNQVAWLIRQEYDRRHGSGLQVATRVGERGLKRDHQHGQTGKE